MRRLIKSGPPKEFLYFLNEIENKEVITWEKLNPDLKKVIRDSLLKETFGKCVYCETKVNDDYSSVIDHFYPKYLYKNKTFNWENLFISCPICDRYKKSKFPTDKNGTPLLLNPFLDNIEDNLNYNEDGSIEPLTEKGKITIDTLGLNRINLCNRRKEKWLSFIHKYSLANSRSKTNKINKLKRFKEEINNELEFYAFINALFNKKYSKFLDGKKINKFIKRKKYKTKKYDLDSKLKLEDYRNKTIYINHVKIKNFKILSSLEIFFNDMINESDPIPCLMLLGENGTGKTTVLHAIALALLSYNKNEELNKVLDKNYFLNAYNKKISLINIEYSEVNEVSNIIIKNKKVTIKNSGQKLPVLLYGSTRIEKNEAIRKLKPILKGDSIRVDYIFRNQDFLDNAIEWLNSLEINEFNIVSKILKDILDLKIKESIKRNNKRIVLNENNKEIPINFLSEGKRNIIVLICDILKTMYSIWNTKKLTREVVTDYSGIVLIDEIGAYLHPTWKMKIVIQLRNIFPKLQFICTTHDPLCLKGFRSGEIVVLRKDKRGKIFSVYNQDLPNPERMDAEQLLTSPYFGLNSTLDPKLEKKFEQYYELLAEKEKLSKEKLLLLDELEKELRSDKDNLMGNNYREDLLYKLIDYTNAKRKVNKGKKNISIYNELIQMVDKLLKEKKI